DDDVGPQHAGADLFQRGKHLLVHAVLPANVGAVGKEAQVVDHGHAGGAARPGVANEPGWFGWKSIDQSGQARAVLCIDPVVGVEPERPGPAGLGLPGVAGGGEIVDPGEVVDPGAQRRGQVAGAVGGTGVDDDDL